LASTLSLASGGGGLIIVAGLPTNRPTAPMPS